MFDKHRRSFKGSSRRSRTEEFLEWAEENPDEVLVVQQGEADEALKKLLREERDLGRLARSRTPYRQSPAEVDQGLADLPF